MKKLILISIFCAANLLLISEEIPEKMGAGKYLKHLIESAHPTPTKYEKETMPYFLTGNPNPSVFLDVNTIEEAMEDGDPNKMQNESSIAVNPTNPDLLISSAVDYRDNSSTWIYVSTDRGKTWTNQNLGKPFPNWRSTNDPSVAYSSDGVGYLCYGGFGPGQVIDGIASIPNGVFLGRSLDGGLTWDAHIPVILHSGPQTPDSTFEDKYYVHVDNSQESDYLHHVYIPWKRVLPRDSSTQIVISKSMDRGSTWSEPLAVSDYLPGTSEDTTFGQSFPLARTGLEGEVYVVWNHGIVHGVGFVKSMDGGASYTEPRIIHNYNIFGIANFLEGQGYRHTVKGKVRAEAYPSFEVDITDGPNRGNIYLCWAADRVPNIYFSRSTDQGETWSDPVIVHSDTSNDQFWPWLAIDPTNGDIAIMYFDSRDDPENLLVETYVSYSNDGGLTWIDRKASDVGHDLRNNPFTGNSFAGDYNGCAFYDGIIYPSWVDMRNTNNDFRDSDVYTAIVDTRAPNPVENLQSQIFADQPKQAKITWENPTEYAFGQEMPQETFVLRLLRDGEFITTLPSDVEEYLDEDLTPYQEYNYEIYVVADRDSSIARNVNAFPGGSRFPDVASISNVILSEDNSVEISVEIPTTKSDGVTSLNFLKRMMMYRDGEYIRDIELQRQDTGIVVSIVDDVPQRGWYTYNFVVVDSIDAENVNYSDYSERLLTFIGEPIVSDYFEGFEEELPKYYLSGDWGRSDEFTYSGFYSFTESISGNYGRAELDTFFFIPIVTNESFVKMGFYHAAFVRPGDAFTLQYSFDLENWQTLASFNQEDYEPWADGVRNFEDWKYEEFEIEVEENQRLYLNFQFASNNILESEGWYVDNITFGSLTSVEDKAETIDLTIYPQPVSNTLYWNKEVNRILVYDLLGNQLIEAKGKLREVNVSNLQSGAYYIKLIDLDNATVTKQFIKY